MEQTAEKRKENLSYRVDLLAELKKEMESGDVNHLLKLIYSLDLMVHGLFSSIKLILHPIVWCTYGLTASVQLAIYLHLGEH